MTEEPGVHTLSEIRSQPLVWPAALDAFAEQTQRLAQLWREPPKQVMFIGCGSTHYLSMIGAALFQALTGVPALARPSSELLLFPDLVYAPDVETWLVPVSRSGTTTETVEAVKTFRVRHEDSKVIAITCNAETPLARQADVCLAVSEAQEESIAQTRSFSSMVVLAQALAAHFGDADRALLDELPAVLRRLFEVYRDLAQEIGEDTSGIERFFFLGSGMLYGVACEAMLKMKEMSLSYSEAYHTLEFRHGPMSMVDDKTLVIGLVSEEARAQEVAMLRDMYENGAQVLAIAEDSAPFGKWTRGVVALKSGLPGWARSVLYLPVLQLMAYHHAMAKGQNPDKPARLEAVVSLDAASLHT